MNKKDRKALLDIFTQEGWEKTRRKIKTFFQVKRDQKGFYISRDIPITVKELFSGYEFLSYYKELSEKESQEISIYLINRYAINPSS